VSVESLRRLAGRVITSRLSWWLMLCVYAGAVLIVLAPVLLTSVGADDTYWILEKGPAADGSIWTAFWSPLSHAFDFSGQPRGTALALSERQVLALVTMRVATTFAIPPFMIWAAVKVALFAMSIVAVVVFLRQIRFRDAQRTLKGLGGSSIAFIAIALPLAIAIGAKSQNQTTLNGWNFYPTLTYGTFVGYLLFAALILRVSRLLQGNYRVWVAPVIVLMVALAVGVNLSYELLALTIPISVLVLALQPQPDGATLWLRWRAKLTVLVALVIPFTVLFVWIRWRISEMACQATHTCYSGTEVQIDARTLLHNFVGAFPGNNGAFVSDQASAVGRTFPTASGTSVGVAVLGAAALLGLWASWRAQHERRDAADAPRTEAQTDDGGDVRGLLVVLAVGLSIAVGTAVITGITTKAVDSLQTPMLSYRSGVATWSALALCGVTIVRLLMLVPLRVAGAVAVAGLVAVEVVSVSMYLPRNILSAQENRRAAPIVFADSLHREVALGDTSRSGDARRCDSIRQELLRRHQNASPTFQRTLTDANKAFEFYHHEPFCSTGAGLEPQSRG
jgi:hypothetical protein